MSRARLVITAVVVEGRRPAEVAQTYGVSRSWVYELVARYRAEGESAFEARSRRPRRSPRTTDPGTVARPSEPRVLGRAFCSVRVLAGGARKGGGGAFRVRVRRPCGLGGRIGQLSGVAVGANAVRITSAVLSAASGASCSPHTTARMNSGPTSRS